jgi:hypothetical protein
VDLVVQRNKQVSDRHDEALDESVC